MAQALFTSPLGAWSCCAAMALIFGLPLAAEEAASEEPASPWSSKAELSLVSTSGNSRSTSFGFAGSVTHAFEQSSVKFSVSGLRAETATEDRRAVGSPLDFRILDRSETETTAENYEADLRADRKLASGRSWYGNVKWRQDEFAGFDSRLTIGSGIAFPIVDKEHSKWTFESGLTWNREEDLDGLVDEFGGVRLALEGNRRLTENSTFELLLEVDENIDETSDVRAELYTGIKVAMNKNLSLKVSLDLRFDNLPALSSLALENEDGTMTGESVSFELDDIDSELKASLVVEF